MSEKKIDQEKKPIVVRRLTSEQIFFGSRRALRERIAYYTEEGKSLSFEEIKELYIRFSTDEILKNLKKHSGDREEKFDITLIPHTIQFSLDNSINELNPRELNELRDRKRRRIPVSIEDKDSRENILETEVLLYWRSIAEESLNDEQKAELVTIFFDQLRAVTQIGKTHLLPEKFSLEFAFLLKDIHKEPIKTKIVKRLLDFVLENEKTREGLFDYVLSYVNPGKFYENYWRNTLRNLCIFNFENFVRAVLSYPDLDDRIKPLLGLVLTRGGQGLAMADFLNIMRKMRAEYREEKKDLELRNLDEKIRFLMGLSENVPIHDALEDLYAAIDFSQYERNIKAQEQDESVIRLCLSGEGKILDLACGTGRLIAPLLERDFHEVCAVDKSQANLDKIPENVRQGAKILRSNWYRLPFKSDYFQSLICLGRSLTHVESPGNLNRVVAEIGRVVAQDGFILVDFPDPTKGFHGEEIQRFRQIAERLKIPRVFIENMWVVVDSPDSENFYNRYLPTKEEVIKSFEVIGGFKLEKVVVGEIPGLPEDKNLYFKFKKKKRTRRGFFSVSRDSEGKRL